jgi:hypothetical protein
MAGEMPPDLLDLDARLSEEAARQLREGEVFQDLAAIPYAAILTVTTASIDGFDSYSFYKVPPPDELVGARDRWLWLNGPTGHATNVMLKGACSPATNVIAPDVIKYDLGLQFYEFVEFDAADPGTNTYNGRPMPALHNLTREDIAFFTKAGLLVGSVDGRKNVDMRWHMPVGEAYLTPPVTQVAWTVHGDNMSGRPSHTKEDDAGEN